MLDSNSICNLFLSAILNVIGNQGTLVVPSFTYSFCKGKEFNIKETSSECGSFSEYIRLHPNSMRSADPNFSVCSIGRKSKLFTENAPNYSFGENTFFDVFYKNDGKICNFNFDSASTFIHFFERLFKVPYRYDKPFFGRRTTNNSVAPKKSYYHFVYDIELTEHSPDFGKFDMIAKKTKVAKMANLGRGQIVVIKTSDMSRLIKRELEKDPQFLILGRK